MSLFKKYWVIFVSVLPLLIMVLIWQCGENYFKPDAKKWAEPSFDQTNIITSDDIKNLEGEKMFIYLDKNNNVPSGDDIIVMNINSESIFEKDKLKTIRNFNGSVIISSESPALSARTWMIISQAGIRNLYILINEDNESFKNEFRPDSTIRPELIDI